MNPDDLTPVWKPDPMRMTSAAAWWSQVYDDGVLFRGRVNTAGGVWLAAVYTLGVLPQDAPVRAFPTVEEAKQWLEDEDRKRDFYAKAKQARAAG